MKCVCIPSALTMADQAVGQQHLAAGAINGITTGMNRDADAIVHAFNDCINRGNLDGLGALMSDDHRFTDAASNTISGKPSCLEAWKAFFSAFPDYRNRFDRTIVRGNEVIIIGSSICSDDRLAGPAIWRARLSGKQIEEWCVLDDTPETRNALGISD